MTKNQKIGAALIIIPIALLLFISTAYPVSQFIISRLSEQQAVDSTGLSNASSSVTILRLMRVVFGLLSTLAVLGIFIGIPLAIYFFVKKDNDGNSTVVQLQNKWNSLWH